MRASVHECKCAHAHILEKSQESQGELGGNHVEANSLQAGYLQRKKGEHVCVACVRSMMEVWFSGGGQQWIAGVVGEHGRDEAQASVHRVIPVAPNGEIR